MEYRFLGRSGLRVSALSYGSWVTFGQQADEQLAYDCMVKAWDHGVNFFDNAEAYAQGESERLMGKALKRAGWRREDYVVSTKIFWGGKGVNAEGLSRKHIVEGVHRSLRHLQLDYVDLLFCHRPDLHTPIEETVWAMHNMVEQGKALYWGTSMWTADQIRQAHAIARREHLLPPLMEQPQYHMFDRERVEVEYAPLYDELGLGTTTWSPLASGILTGKYNDGIPEGSRMSLDGYEWLREKLESERGREQVEKTRQLQPVADDLGCTMAQLAIAWCLANDDVSTVITGASKPSQVEENMVALEVVDKLDAEAMERIEGILDNRPDGPSEYRSNM